MLRAISGPARAGELSPIVFWQDYEKIKDLGKGGDGKVELYAHRGDGGKCVALKAPVDVTGPQEQMTKEIRNLRKLGKHENIVGFLGCDPSCAPCGPKAFLEYCDLGDVTSYRIRLVQEYGYVPEDSIWKLFSDMSKAFNFMHHEQETPMIHGDLKPDNILVTRPPGWSSENLCVVPIFKLADFSRAQLYAPGKENPTRWFGTNQFQPPEQEHRVPTPAVDIWGLGASLQSFVLGIFPTQSTDAFMEELPELHSEEYFLGIENPSDQSEIWESVKPVVHRPLNTHPLIDGPPEPYTEPLEQWYRLCLEENFEARITAAQLVEYVVPIADRQMQIIQAKRLWEQHRGKLDQLKRERKKREKAEEAANARRRLGDAAAPRRPLQHKLRVQSR